MAIIRKLKQGETTIFPMTDASAVQYADKTLSEMIEEGFYSTQPVKIGTWVNGTPIYRVAIPFQYFYISNYCKHSETNNSVYVDTNSILSSYLKDSGNTVFVNANNIIGYSEYPNLILQTYSGDGVPGRIYFSYETPTLYEDLITFNNGFFGGWIEFATPENNLIS